MSRLVATTGAGQSKCLTVMNLFRPVRLFSKILMLDHSTIWFVSRGIHQFAFVVLCVLGACSPSTSYSQGGCPANFCSTERRKEIASQVCKSRKELSLVAQPVHFAIRESIDGSLGHCSCGCDSIGGSPSAAPTEKSSVGLINEHAAATPTQTNVDDLIGTVKSLFKPAKVVFVPIQKDNASKKADTTLGFSKPKCGATVSIGGGVAFASNMTIDALAFVLAHEIGHRFVYWPECKKSDERAADTWGAEIGMRLIFSGADGPIRLLSALGPLESVLCELQGCRDHKPKINPPEYPSVECRINKLRAAAYGEVFSDSCENAEM